MQVEESKPIKVSHDCVWG